MQKTCHNGNFFANIIREFRYKIHINVESNAYGCDIKCVHWIWRCLCARISFIHSLSALLFMNNGFPNSIQINSVENGQWLPYNFRSSISSNLWFTLGIVSKPRWYLRAQSTYACLLIYYFGIFGFCTGNIFAHKMGPSIDAYALFFAENAIFRLFHILFHELIQRWATSTWIMDLYFFSRFLFQFTIHF